MSRALILSMKYAPSPDRSYRFRAFLYVTPNRLNRQDIEYLYKALSRIQRSSKPVHIVIIFHSGIHESDLELELKKLERELLVKVLAVQITRLMDKIQLAAIGRAIWESSEEVKPFELTLKLPNERSTLRDVDVDELRSKLRELWEELGIEDLLSTALRPPLVIEDLVLEPPIAKYKDFVDVMKWLLSVPRRKFSVREAFDYVSKKLMSIHIYGTKKGLLSQDIESSDRLREYVKVLAKQGFVEYVPDEDIVIPDKLSEYEHRVLEILEKICGGECTEEVLREFFVFGSPNAERTWETVLDILSLRALIFRGTPQDLERYGIKASVNSRKSSIIVALDNEKAKRLIGEWKNSISVLLEQDRELVSRLGYIVSGKERRWSAFTVMELLDYIVKSMDSALKALDFDTYLALRLARMSYEAMDYYVSEVRCLLKGAEGIAVKLKNELREIREALDENLKILQDLISTYIASRPISIKLKLVDQLSKAVDELNEIYASTINEQEFLNQVESLWRIYRGKEFPFYFRARGPLYFFNYKLWLIHAKLNKFVELGDQGLKIRDDLREATERLERLVAFVKSIVERARHALADRDSILNKMRKSEILAPLTSALKDLDISKIVATDIEAENIADLETKVRDVVSKWVSYTEALSSKLSSIEKLIQEISSLEERLSRRAEELHGEVLRYKSVLDLCGYLYDCAPRCYREIERIGTLITEALHRLEKVKRIAEEEKPVALEDLEKLLSEIKNNLDTIERDLEYGRLVECKRLDDEILSSIESRLSSLKSLAKLTKSIDENQFEQLMQYIEKLAPMTKSIPMERACSLIQELEEMLKKARNTIISARALDNDEVEIYIELNKIKMSRNLLKFNEAVELLAQRLGFTRDQIKRKLLNLIEKELIDVYI